jgi:hypothetical protein
VLVSHFPPDEATPGRLWPPVPDFGCRLAAPGNHALANEATGPTHGLSPHALGRGFFCKRQRSECSEQFQGSWLAPSVLLHDPHLKHVYLVIAPSRMCIFSSSLAYFMSLGTPNFEGHFTFDATLRSHPELHFETDRIIHERLPSYFRVPGSGGLTSSYPYIHRPSHSLNKGWSLDVMLAA